MRILLFTDVHWSAKSSIVTKFGTKYTTRLEMLLNSMNWINETAVALNCDQMICAGDMMDKSSCSDMELTALQDIKWNNLPCYFLCGNHESSTADLQFNTVKSLESETRIIITKPTIYTYPDFELCLLPYIVESNRQALDTYFNNKTSKRVIISHNDIAGINYGAITSKLGFTIDEIENNCDLYLNGHLHNSEFITPSILNLGSLSAHNFTNDSMIYKYGCWILDTQDMSLKFIENPYAFNFYKFDILEKSDFKKLKELKNNAVVTIKCNSDLIDTLKAHLLKYPQIIESRIIITKNICTEVSDKTIDFTVDYIARFIDCVHAHYGTDPILESELSEICK